MTPEQQLEKLLHELSELTRYDKKNYLSMPGGFMEEKSDGEYILFSDIEAILKQTFPDDEFH